MTAHIKGTVKQTTTEVETFQWKAPKPWIGNEIKSTSISEIDATLDTSRFHISIPTSGEEPYQIDGKNYSAKAGEYFIFNPKQSVRASGIFNKEIKGNCIFLTEQTIQETAYAIGQPIEKSLESPFDYSWQQQEFMIKSFRLQENSFGQYLSRIQHILLSEEEHIMDWDTFYFELASKFLQTHRQIGEHLQAIPATQQITKQEIYKRLGLAHAYILENFDQPFSLDELGKISLISKFHFLRLYRMVYGQTPYQHVLHLRIERAKVLLRKNYSISGIAQLLSFSDRRAFAKIFKKKEGIAPSAFQTMKGHFSK